MFRQYLNAAMHRAAYKILPDDSTFFGNIPGFEGVWANAPTLEATRDELEEVLEEWILFRISRNLPLPEVDGLRLEFKEAV
ncbi:MAG TPA: type II toxin-antitoxin system HicB family antitoxin [Ktedonobacterales bacterium]|nr:type II toxin-antitoxin system HicB family antitoxin [Ktedonobacterales bacterium]